MATGCFLLAQVPPLLLKDIFFSVVKFPVFDVLRRAILSYDPALRDSLSSLLLVSMVCGSISGVLAAFVSQPADTVFTRVTTDQESSSGRQSGSAIGRAFQAVVSESGMQGLYKGVGPRAVFCGALLALEFLIYDYLRNLLHVSSGDLMVFLDVLGSVRESR